jgi:hypothetical protein
MKKFWDWVERILNCLDKIPSEKEEDIEKDLLKKVDIIKSYWEKVIKIFQIGITYILIS